MNSLLDYSSGEDIRVGDRIVGLCKEATVEMVILPETKEATDYECYETGGVIFIEDDGTRIQWSPEDGYELTLLMRGQSNNNF